jgi:hypothetical protein
MFQLAEASYRHVGEMGVSDEVMRLLAVPGGAGMVVCPSSFLGSADLIKKTGRLNPKRLFHQDPDFMLRLAMLTGFCYVNLPLVRFDRSPAEIRHVGVSAAWNEVEFVLRDTQDWYEELLNLGDKVPPRVRSLIRQHLGSVYSGLANCHLEAGQYGRAREAALKALQMRPRLNMAAKCFLTWTSPGAARRAVRRHLERKKDLDAFI